MHICLEKLSTSVILPSRVHYSVFIFTFILTLLLLLCILGFILLVLLVYVLVQCVMSLRLTVTTNKILTLHCQITQLKLHKNE